MLEMWKVVWIIIITRKDTQGTFRIPTPLYVTDMHVVVVGVYSLVVSISISK